MKLLEVTQPELWEEFQVAQPWAQFLQSWAWGEFRVSQNGKIRRFALVDESDQWVAAVQFEYRARRFGLGYWFAARGPIFAPTLPVDARREVVMNLCLLLSARQEFCQKTLFWRIEPAAELNSPEGLIPLRFRRAPSMNPSSTVLLDMSPSVDVLLAQMHEKTRYNIRLAERKGVQIRVASTPKDVEAFLTLMDETAKRDGFVQHSHAYLEATYRFLQEKGFAQIRMAEWNGKLLSANFEVLYGDTMTYLHGASSSTDRNVMAPFALHWNAIQDAKTRGFRLYDFWGANPQSKAMPDFKPSWEGISRFKQGWGGVRTNVVGTWDMPLHVVMYRLAFLKRFFRG